MPEDRLSRQLEFVLELDKLKGVLRRTIIGEGRRENSAEHSWHFALMAVLLAEYANEPIDLLRVVKMALVHDIVEIDAGDTFIYDEKGELDKAERENRAADRIFGLLPTDQAAELRSLWEEYERHETSEARFAAALDRLNPLMLNYARQGETWRQHGVRADRVFARNAGIAEGSSRLWDYARQLIADAVSKGYLEK